MDPLAALNHLLNFAAPALGVGVPLALISRILWRKRPPALGLLAQAAIHCIVGCAVLAAGLLWLGRDGKMLTYGLLVLACASCQWVLVRGWR